VERFCAAGGEVVSPSAEISIGRVAVVRDPFGNLLVLLDMSKGRYLAASAVIQAHFYRNYG
jgi:hypothetical protein